MLTVKAQMIGKLTLLLLLFVTSIFMGLAPLSFYSSAYHNYDYELHKRPRKSGYYQAWDKCFDAKMAELGISIESMSFYDQLVVKGGHREENEACRAKADESYPLGLAHLIQMLGFSVLILWLLIWLPIGLLWQPVRYFLHSIEKRRYDKDSSLMSYSRDGLTISVDKVRKMIALTHPGKLENQRLRNAFVSIFPFLLRRTVELPVKEFGYSWEDIEKVVTYNTGGTQFTAIGSIYIPGQAGSYVKRVGRRLILWHRGTGEPLGCFDIPLYKRYDSNLLSNIVLTRIAVWRDGIEREENHASDDAAADKARATLRSLLKQTGMSPDADDCFYIYENDKSGKLTQVLAADRAGHAFAVYENGKVMWNGKLVGAMAKIAGDQLDIRVEDAAYRDQHLTQRHILVLKGKPREELVEWMERINLIAKQAAATDHSKSEI